MEIASLVKMVGSWSEGKGWRKGWELGTKLLLVNSEVAEAFEEVRNNHSPQDIYFPTISEGDKINPIEQVKLARDRVKPEGFAVELADAVIRICDICDYYNINLEHALELKMAYNFTREYRHGGKSA